MVMVQQAKASANPAGERMQGDLVLELDWCCDEACPGTPRLRAELAMELGGCSSISPQDGGTRHVMREGTTSGRVHEGDELGNLLGQECVTSF